MTDGQNDPLGRRRVAVLGAGALGSVYGGVLARSGLDVQLLGREEHARAIQRHGGLRVLSAEGSWLAPLRGVWRPVDVEPAEIVIMMAKTPDTLGALAGLDHLLPALRVALSWQNGLSKADILADWCGPDRVVGGASMVGAVGVSPGTVRHTFTGPTFVGELPEGTSSRTAGLTALLDRAGLPAVDTPKVRSIEWSKLVQVLPAMSLTALTRLPYHEVLTSPRLSTLFAQLIRETAAVAVAAGAGVADWPGMLPVGTLASLPEEAAAARVREFGQSLVDSGRVHIKPSMLQSVERGRRLEVEAIQGYVAREAVRLGVETPTVALCYEMLASIDATLS